MFQQMYTLLYNHVKAIANYFIRRSLLFTVISVPQNPNTIQNVQLHNLALYDMMIISCANRGNNGAYDLTGITDILQHGLVASSYLWRSSK